MFLALQITSDLHLIITLQGKYNYPHFLDKKWLNILPKIMWLPRSISPHTISRMAAWGNNSQDFLHTRVIEYHGANTFKKII